MLSRLTVRFLFSKQAKYVGERGEIDSNVTDVLMDRRRIREELYRRQKSNLPMEQSLPKFYESLVKITLFMRQDCWQSQYLYLLLNYNHLGFRRISDLVFLDRASYMLNLRQVKDEERWPSIRVVVALQPKIILSGVSPICEFFRENAYFLREVDRHSSEIQSLQQHIDAAVLPHLESIFWHPKLTFQYSFHTNISSYQDTTRNYSILGILARNFALIGSRVARNLVSIAREGERYRSSKGKLTAAIKELQSIYLGKASFFGGEQPNHVDFYLLAQLKTREGSSLFMRYLQQSIGGEFWRWWVRMSALCHYDPQRITML